MLLVLLFTLLPAHANLCAHADFTREVTALQKLLPQPPCELPKDKTPLEIVLIGENHYLPTSASIRELGVRRGARGEVAFLSETSPQGALLQTEVPSLVATHRGDPSRAALVGLESSAGIGLLLAYSIQYPHNENDESKALRLLRRYAPHSPLLRDSIEAARAGNAEEQARAVKMEALIDGDGDIVPPEGTELYVRKVTAAAFALAGSKYAAQLDGGTWPDLPYQADSPEYTSRHERLMSIRDRDFGRVAGREICSLARRHARIFVNVGDAHAEAMRRQLLADFGSTIKLRYLDPHKPAEAEEALHLISEQ